MSIFNTKKSLSRRTLLQGSGVAVALPFLSAMLPAHAKAKDELKSNPKRFVAICADLGFQRSFFFPKQPGKNYELSPYLNLIKDHRQDFTVLSGLSHPNQNGANGHSSTMTWLTSIERPALAGFRNRISIDQLIADKVGSQTRYPYLCLSTVSNGLAWNANGVKIRAENSALRLYKKLFINGSKSEIDKEINALQQGKSILDTISKPAKRIHKTLGKEDRQKLEEYFSSIRGLEVRLQQNRSWVNKPKPVVDFKVVKDTEKSDVIAQQKLMYELMALALQTDSSRSITFNMAGASVTPSDIPGVTAQWHNLSHHGKSPEKIAELKLIEEAEFKEFNSFLNKLKSHSVGNTNLLDQTAILFGSNLGNAASHDWRNLPILVAGGGYKHGSYIAHDEKDNTHLANLFVSFAQRMDIDIDSFGTSTSSSINGLSY